MSDWQWAWERDGVRFDLRHQSLVADDWRSTVHRCTVQADLYLPSQPRRPIAPGVQPGVSLRAGDIVSSSAVEFGEGRRTASVTLIAMRGRKVIGSGIALFWRQTALPGPRDLSARLASRIRADISVDDQGDAFPTAPQALALRLRDLEQAELARALALGAGLPSDIAQLLQDAWAHLGYQEGLRDAALTPAVGERTQRLDDGRKIRSAKGEPDRRLARKIIWREQEAGRVIDKRKCAKEVFAMWQAISAESPDDPAASSGVRKGIPGIERTIDKLFAKKDSKHRRLAYRLAQDPELHLGQM